MARTRNQIVEAVVALHAERGARDTSYAMIAERADVAVPTVYKHFPSLTELFAACVGHVGGRAPPLGPDVFADAPDAPAQLEALARAIVTRHRYFAPWLRWTAHEAHFIPELAVHHRRADEARRALIAQAVAPAYNAAPPPALLGLLDSLFDYRTWQTLTRNHGLSDEEAAAAIANAGRDLLAGHADASTAPGGTKRNAARRTSP
jgi:AcrR family transcriptional regulator